MQMLLRNEYLDYWLGGNAPVILVRSRPITNEAYWVSIKEYFADPKHRGTRKITFDKKKNRLSNEPICVQSLVDLAMPKGSGLYLSAMPKKEKLYLNLLPIVRFPDIISIAKTRFTSKHEIEREISTFTNEPFPFFLLHAGNIYSLYDLSTHPWNRIVYRDSVEVYRSSLWALDDDKTARDNFVQLLGLVLRYRLAANGVDYHEQKEYYYFRDTNNLLTRKIQYNSLLKKTERTVFEPYEPKDAFEPVHYRHSAFIPKYVRYDDTWYLEINPTYHFTADGRKIYRFSHSSLSGLKRLEKNGAVIGQLIMWSEFIKSIFPSVSLLNLDDATRIEFASLQGIEIERGIPDKAWLKSEETDEATAIELDIESLGLFGL